MIAQVYKRMKETARSLFGLSTLMEADYVKDHHDFYPEYIVKLPDWPIPPILKEPVDQDAIHSKFIDTYNLFDETYRENLEDLDSIEHKHEQNIGFTSNCTGRPPDTPLG